MSQWGNYPATDEYKAKVLGEKGEPIEDTLYFKRKELRLHSDRFGKEVKKLCRPFLICCVIFLQNILNKCHK